MSAKILKFATKVPEPPGRSCDRCKHRVVTEEHPPALTSYDIAEGVRLEGDEKGVKRVYFVDRCSKDIARGPHPFFNNKSYYPVLTCREMRKNACRGAVLWEPLRKERKPELESA